MNEYRSKGDSEMKTPFFGSKHSTTLIKRKHIAIWLHHLLYKMINNRYRDDHLKNSNLWISKTRSNIAGDGMWTSKRLYCHFSFHRLQNPNWYARDELWEDWKWVVKLCQSYLSEIHIIFIVKIVRLNSSSLNSNPSKWSNKMDPIH